MTNIDKLLKTLLKFEHHIRPVRDHAAFAMKLGSILATDAGSREFEWAANAKELREADEILREAESLAASDSFDCPADVLVGIRKVRVIFDQGIARFEAAPYDGYVDEVHDQLVGTLMRAGDVLAQLAKAVGDDEGTEEDSVLSRITELQERAVRGTGDSCNADIIESLGELKRCFSSQCFIACMCLCGRMIEAALKMRFMRIPAEQRKLTYNAFKKKFPEIGKKEVDDLGLGELLALSGSEAISDEFKVRLSDAMKQDANKIKLFRNSYAHARGEGETPIPSEDDTRSVIYTLAEVLTRTYEFLDKFNTPPGGESPSPSHDA